MNYDVVSALVSRAIEDVNAQREDKGFLIDSPETPLLAENAVIDSLGFAFLVVTIEQYVLDELGAEIVIFDDEVMEMDFDSELNPSTTVGSLTAFVARKLT